MDPTTIALWATFGLSLAGSVGWYRYANNIVAALPERFRDQFVKYHVWGVGSPIAFTGIVGGTSLLGLLAVACGTFDLQMGVAVLVAHLLAHGVAASGIHGAKNDAHYIVTGLPELEFKLTNANDPATQVEILRQFTEDGSRLHQTETCGNPRKLASVMTGEKGILYAEAFADLGVKQKLKILAKYQQAVVQSLDPDSVTSYLKALTVLLPRYSQGEQGAIVAGALRMLLERRDAEMLTRFMVDCEIHLPAEFWKEHGTNVKNLLITARDDTLDDLDAALTTAIANVRKLCGEKPASTGESAEDKTRRERALAVRIAVIRGQG